MLLDNPIKKTGGLVILKGNLAPEGCVIKVAGTNRKEHHGPARVFNREEGTGHGGDRRQDQSPQSLQLPQYKCILGPPAGPS